MSDGSALHELRLVFGGLLQAAPVRYAVEKRLVRACHHRGTLTVQAPGEPHGSGRGDDDDLVLLSFPPKWRRLAGTRR